MPKTRSTTPKQHELAKNSSKKNGIVLSVASGILASVASVVAKLALDTPNVSLAFRVALLITMIIVNSVMWTTYSKALDSCSSAVVASVMNTLANFATTAILGVLLFQETHVFSFLWSSGMILVILGLCILLHENKKNKETMGGDVLQDVTSSQNKWKKVR